MSEQADERLHPEVRSLIQRAAAHITATPLTTQAAADSASIEDSRTNINGLIEELAEAESRLSSSTADDDALLAKARTTLGALYATRYLRSGWAEEDRRGGTRLLRAARASGHLNAETDANELLLLAILLLPADAANGKLRSLDGLNRMFAFGEEIADGGRALDDLREMRVLLGEIVAERPDDPRVGPLVRLAETLHQLLSLVQGVASGAVTSIDQLGSLTAGLVPDPSGQLGLMINTLMSFGREFAAMPEPEQPSSGSKPTGESDQDDSALRNKLALLLEMSVPGTIGPGEMSQLIGQIEAEGDGQSPGIAVLGRFTQAIRSNDPRDLERTVQDLRRLVESAPSASTAWLAGSIFPAVLSASSMSHGNRQDDAKAAEQLSRDWSSLSPDGVLPAMHEPGVYGLSVGRAMLDYSLRLSQALAEEDDAPIEQIVQELTEAERSGDSASEWHVLTSYQLSFAEIALADRKKDAEILRRANHRLGRLVDAPVPAAVRPLVDAVWPMVLTASAVLERRPAELTEAITRARASLERAPMAHDQHTFTRLGIALALKAQHALVEEPDKSAALREAVDALEQARNALTEHSGAAAIDRVLWQLAEAYRMRGDESLDEDGLDDNGRAVALVLESLRVVADDVLLQLGTEHGLSAARAAADRGLRAAGWALAGGRVEQAIECLERGRALVLGAAAAARTVPDRLRAAGEAELAEQWEQSTPSNRSSSTPSIDANTPMFAPADHFISVPSDLRRRALAALRRNGDSSPSAVDGRKDSSDDQVGFPSAWQLAHDLDRADVDALVYLLPETDTEGRAVVVRRDGTVRDLPLLGLSAARRVPFEQYLSSAARRSVEGRGKQEQDKGAARDLSAAQHWGASLDELCDWAGKAVFDKLIDVLPGEPGPDAPARVVLVPCGTLGLVPWHAAKLSRRTSGAGPNRPLRACDLVVVSYAASAGELLRSLARERTPHAADPVIVVDPSGTLPYAAPEAVAIRSAYLPKARLMGFVEGYEIEAPGTPDDVLTLLTGRDGDAPASMLQITAHGTASTRPTASRLLLADPGGTSSSKSSEISASSGNGGAADAGYLTVANILDASRTGAGGRLVSLVVLDCCDTDLSSRDYDEALTLTTAFVARGATDAIGSRWSIDDWSSAVCMVVFHHYLTERRLAPSDALRAAQLWMLGPAREHIPVLADDLLKRMDAPLDAVSAWASFIHQGSARPG